MWSCELKKQGGVRHGFKGSCRYEVMKSMIAGALSGGLPIAEVRLVPSGWCGVNRHVVTDSQG